MVSCSGWALGSLKDKVEINKYSSSENVNSWWAESLWEPYIYWKNGYLRNKIKKDTVFVRVYDGKVSGMYGGWVMKGRRYKRINPFTNTR